MLSCLPSTRVANRDTQTVRPQQNELTSSVVSEQEASLPRPISAPLAQQNNWKPTTSSMVMGLCLLGLATSIGLSLLGRSQNDEQNESPGTTNDLTKLSLFLLVVSVCTASLNAAWDIANRRA